jgi:hypothetical protein
LALAREDGKVRFDSAEIAQYVFAMQA